MSKIFGRGAGRRLVSLAVAGLMSWAVAGSSYAQSTSSVVISEVDPTGSSATSPNTGYQTDWFELTNTGSTAVDISAWTMEDSHANGTGAPSIANNTKSAAAPLTISGGGGQSIAAGQSVIFFESSSAVDPTAFEKAWWGSVGNAPGNLLFGIYNDTSKGNFGLSSGGDSVNIFSGSANNSSLIEGVTFGAVSTVGPSNALEYETFQVAADGTVTSSQAGVAGAFVSANGQEVGSPGVVPLPPSVWLLLSGIGLLAVSKRVRSPDAPH